jgi:hypothetical protein
MSAPLSRSQPEARQRRERYYELRREGVPSLDAAAGVDVFDWRIAQRYERWFQATESGQQIIPGSRWPHKRREAVITPSGFPLNQGGEG